MIDQSKGTVEECLEIEDRNKMLDEGTYPEKLGFYQTRDGGLLVAGNIPMPDVTADMLTGGGHGMVWSLSAMQSGILKITLAWKLTKKAEGAHLTHQFL